MKNSREIIRFLFNQDRTKYCYLYSNMLREPNEEFIWMDFYNKPVTNKILNEMILNVRKAQSNSLRPFLKRF